MTTCDTKVRSVRGRPGWHHVSQTARTAKSCSFSSWLRRSPFASANGLIGTNVPSEYPAARIATVSLAPRSVGVSHFNNSAQVTGGPLGMSGFPPLLAQPLKATATPIGPVMLSLCSSPIVRIDPSPELVRVDSDGQGRIRCKSNVKVGQLCLQINSETKNT